MGSNPDDIVARYRPKKHRYFWALGILLLSLLIALWLAVLIVIVFDNEDFFISAEAIVRVSSQELPETGRHRGDPFHGPGTLAVSIGDGAVGFDGLR